MARSVLGELDVEVVLTRVLESARAVTGARYAALGVLDPARQRLERFLTLGIDDDDAHRIGPRPTGRGVLGELITHPMPLRLPEVGAHPHSYGFPPGHPPMDSFLGVPVLIRGQPYGNLYVTQKEDAGSFTQEDEEALVLLAELAGLSIDHARRFSGSESQRVQLESTVEALEATIEIARALAGQTDMTSILQLVAKRGRALVGARLLVIEVQTGPDLTVAAGAGQLPDGFVGVRLTAENTVAATAIATRRTQRLSDKLNWARFQQHGAGRFDLGARDGLVVPMVFRGETFGVLLAIDHMGPTGPAFDAEHRHLLEAFAASAAMAAATAQSAANERRRQVMAAAEAERTRWARELHDETLQAMASVKLMLSAARRSPDEATMRETVDAAVEQLQADMDNLRALVADLRPGSLDQLGIEAAITDLIERVGRTGLEVDADIQLAFEQNREPSRLAPDLETAVYRTVQESLNNAIKHSGATRAVVEVVEHDGTVEVRVRDNGSGFDTSRASSGFGLVGMRERVALIDGTLEIGSEPGRGTTVCARFEVRRDGAEPRPLSPLVADG